MASRGLLPVVHTGGMYYGGVEALRTIAASAVMDVQSARPMRCIGMGRAARRG
jgi:hypothetical protein